ncbi:hypothetical protein EVAR_65820_1 [Eumeta japonica]|uniref:Uncharacterized protein n=1 Tax=Eumeta variegata TaxID=151549 RepID=A0A4C1ZQC0_EUMVA|nr:hypothetical protein EVAR_65820_1 [Eumeta japonica]
MSREDKRACAHWSVDGQRRPQTPATRGQSLVGYRFDSGARQIDVDRPPEAPAPRHATRGLRVAPIRSPPSLLGRVAKLIVISEPASL